MKCPKCGYIGFEAADRCRNCGYDFSLADRRTPPPDLSLREGDRDGPLADLPLERGRDAGTMVPPPVPSTPAAHRRAAAPATDHGDDLPLFAPALGEEGARGALPAPRAPLAVRRTPTPVARARVRPAEPRAQPSLDLEAPASDPVPVSEAAPAAAELGRAPGLARRFAAAVLDAALLMSVNLVIVYFTLRVCRVTAADIAVLPPGPMLAFLAIIDAGYLWAFTAAGGQTLGKMAFGLHAVGRNHAALTPGRAVVRAVLSLASAVPLGLGWLLCFFGHGRRALHDYLAGTAVERVPGR